MGMREIAGYPGYFATSQGSIWSKRGAKMARLKPRLDKDGHLTVRLYSGGKARDVAVHRAVAEAWCAGWHPTLEVHHIDGDPANNAASNLACVTPLEHDRIHGIWVDEANVRKERERANELIAAARPAKKGEPGIRGMLRAVQDTETALKRRGIKL